ncbi:AsmA family protein [Thermodesulfobacteriota bacterium]
MKTRKKLKSNNPLKKWFKWMAIIVGALGVLAVVAMITVYMFFDVAQFKHQIEDQIAAATGRSVSLAGELKLSFFPWIGVALSDFSIGNLSAFKEKEFIKVASFETRVRLLPLLKRDIQVKRFVLKSPVIVLITNSDGQTNWSGTGSKTEEKPVEKKGKPADKSGFFRELFQIETFQTEKVTLENATILWVDHARKQYRTISKLNLSLKEVSLQRPIDIDFACLLEKYPLAGKGTLGPVGTALDFKTLPLDLKFKVLNLMNIQMKGKINHILESLSYQLTIGVSSFSPRKLLSLMEVKHLTLPADKKYFDQIKLNTEIQGDLKGISFKNGSMQLDKTKLRFVLTAKKFEAPEITFDIDLDNIDINRYLPAKDSRKTTEEKKPPPDFEPLRKLDIEGHVRGQRLDFNKISVKNFELALSGRNGQFKLHLNKMDLFGGKGKGRCFLDLRKKDPYIRFDFGLAGVRSELASKAVVKKQTVKGPINVKADLSSRGIESDTFLKKLSGKLSVTGKDISLYGLDLDKVLAEYADTQSFGFLDIGSFFVLGPFGPLLTRAYENVDAAATLGKGTGLVKQLNSDWVISKGFASVKDVAFSTRKNRIAVKGKINIVTRRFDNFIVAMVDRGGCPKFSQTLNGPIDHPEIDKASFVGKHIIAPLASLFKRTKKALTKEKCQIFYKGVVPHPAK